MRSDDGFRIQLSWLNKLIDLNDRDLGSHSHYRIETSCCPSIDQVTEDVSFMCFDKGEIRSKGQFQEVLPTMDNSFPFSQFYRSTYTGGGIETPKPTPPCPYSFSQSALR